MVVYKKSTFWILCCLGVIPGIIYYALAKKPKDVEVAPQPVSQRVVNIRNIRWPKACIGCRETDPSKLTMHNYTQQVSGFAGAAPGVIYSRLTSLEVSVHLCPTCTAKAKNWRIRGIFLYIVTVLIVIMTPVLIPTLVGANIIPSWVGTIIYGIIYVIFGWMVLCCWYKWLIKRYRLVNHFMKIQLTHGGTYVFKLKSPEYRATFLGSNPFVIVESKR